jgi:hypothetical protein
VAYLAVGLAVLVLLAWVAKRPRFAVRREWRLLAGALAVAAFAAAAFVGLRGGWGKAIVLVLAGLWLADSVRRQAGTPSIDRQTQEMSLSEARSVLGVGPQADAAEIARAYDRLIRITHPDKGGTAGLTAQLNAARARLRRG